MIRSAKDLLTEVVQKPTEYLEPRALPQFYHNFLQPATEHLMREKKLAAEKNREDGDENKSLEPE